MNYIIQQLVQVRTFLLEGRHPQKYFYYKKRYCSYMPGWINNCYICGNFIDFCDDHPVYDKLVHCMFLLL